MAGGGFAFRWLSSGRLWTECRDTRMIHVGGSFVGGRNASWAKMEAEEGIIGPLYKLSPSFTAATQ